MTEGVELEARQNQTHRTQRTRQNQTQGDTVLLRRGSGGEGPQGPKGPEVRAEGSRGSEDVVETQPSQDWTGVNHSTVRRSTDSNSEEQEEEQEEEEEEEEGSLQHHHLTGLPPHNGPTGEPGAGLSGNGYAQQVAPDGGWGWVVLVATILVLALTLAFPSCIGIFYTELQAEFSSSNTETSWVPAIMTAVLHAGGPLCSVLVERFGCRVTVMVGGVLSGLGMVVSALARTITELYITSIIAGLGFCLSFQPSVTMMGHYFLRRRAFANALSSTGTALGLSTLPLLANFLLGQFGWRGSFLVLGGLLLNCCVCGAVMRPLGAKHSGAQRILTNKAAQGLGKQPIKGPLQQEEGLKARLRTALSDLVVFLRRHMAFDLLVSNPRYRAYALGVTWMMLGFVVPLVYLVPYATANGMEQDRAALLMAILGLVNIAVRPVAAVFFGLPRFRGSGCFVYVFAVALLVNGLSNSICGAAATFPVLLVYVVIFGLSMSVIGSLLFTVLMETVEMSRFPSALGLISMLESGTLLIGPPLAGMLVDSTGHYSYVFYACSVIVSSSGLFLIGAFYYLDRQKKREEKKRAGTPAAYQQKPAIILVPDCQYSHVPSTQGGKPAISLVPDCQSLHVDSPPLVPGQSVSYVHGASSVSLLGQTVGQSLQAAADRWPHREALVFLQDGVRKTFSQFQ
ncbi:monocarboxylate transporter 6-like [Salvelinus fontinalis]|uniref:monocarboxylate transporter 6-like n=1 Tax=Salvelinus fontinalis TaxID=8038 RepID=UPI002485AA7A|nr:monocarboxylate transporter 6-like [Salvelinus fontinalis]